MIKIYIIFVVLAIACAAVVATLVLRYMRHDARVGLGNLDAAHMKRVVSGALGMLNCTVQWEKDDGNYIGTYQYQSGHFRLNVQNAEPYVRLLYPFFYETELDYIETVRQVCNDINFQAEICRLVYSIDGTRGKVHVHIMGMLLLDEGKAKEMLERAMQEAFKWHHDFVSVIKERLDDAKGALNHDAEKRDATKQREQFLVSELEMMYQEAGPDWHDDGATVPLQQLLASAMGLTDIVMRHFSLTRGERVVMIDNPDAIASFDVKTALVDEGRFMCHSAVALLDYYDPRDPVRMRHLTIHFKQEGQTPDTLYYRVTMALTPVSMSRAVSEQHMDRHKQMCSVLMGCDLQPSQKRLERFRYVWKEAMAKEQNGNVADMNEEEKMLCSLRNPRYGQALLRGRALYDQGRFYESVRCLENVFEQMQESYYQMPTAARAAFMEICYMVGACYTHLRQYRKASYYLQITLQVRRVDYMKMFINCLVNGHDFRAMFFIDSFLDDLSAMFNSDAGLRSDESMREVATFMSFLRRRKAFLLVRSKRYDEAELLLKELLSDPASSGFALKQLAYIQKKKQE